ncbi:hypothetical protein M3P05_20665 [Sansalvadorimonas sp. 2012CJ34-2]|uniref:Uncharacterized protein n=1 Tax=Parendozoicomonas callyspongiae TaxID=2942213 RepID=A0ABT0PLW6_9GAMM|nr:hypothetical protein [Sansalvadorimonas sp. 2012CJ34-2]MCL6272333.1 hypothetical protein [Sansalvadorimonas sp. 2012CJ34-2]
MKYEKVINTIMSGKKSRADLISLKIRAEERFKNGDDEAKLILNAINNATPKDSYILFMGFCPGADFNRRLDTEWKKITFADLII